jgi:hypothetical protein
MSIKCIVSLCVLMMATTSVCYADSGFQGSIQPIPIEIQKMMIGKTWHKGCPVALKDLSYLKVSYWGFDNKAHSGEIIIHQRLAPELLSILKKLYDEHFAIEKMILPEKLIGNRKFSTPIEMAVYLDNANDTTAFFCRQDGQNPNDFSPHSFGIAIDINPYYNPAIVAKQYLHFEKGIKYLDRNLKHVGMIKKDDITVNAFIDRGWVWGGYFIQGVDYMHFGKLISTHYQVNHLEVIPNKESIPNLRQGIS